MKLKTKRNCRYSVTNLFSQIWLAILKLQMNKYVNILWIMRARHVRRDWGRYYEWRVSSSIYILHSMKYSSCQLSMISVSNVENRLNQINIILLLIAIEGWTTSNVIVNGTVLSLLISASSLQSLTHSPPPFSPPLPPLSLPPSLVPSPPSPSRNFIILGDILPNTRILHNPGWEILTRVSTNIVK